MEVHQQSQGTHLCLGVSRSRLDSKSSRQLDTFCTGRGLDLTVRGVKQVEAGVRRHQGGILVRSTVTSSSYLPMMFETFWSSESMVRLSKAVYDLVTPEEMVGSVETITPESWIHILCVRSLCFRPCQTKTNLVSLVFTWTTSWEGSA